MTATMTSTNRQCGQCSLCCKVIAVETLDKPAMGFRPDRASCKGIMPGRAPSWLGGSLGPHAGLRFAGNPLSLPMGHGPPPMAPILP